MDSALVEWLMAGPGAPELPSLATFLDRPKWMAEGACRGMAAQTFFLERGGSAAEAKATCRSCPVEAECLAFALADPELNGLWGGTSERERKAMRRQSAA